MVNNQNKETSKKIPKERQKDTKEEDRQNKETRLYTKRHQGKLLEQRGKSIHKKTQRRRQV